MEEAEETQRQTMVQEISKILRENLSDECKILSMATRLESYLFRQYGHDMNLYQDLGTLRQRIRAHAKIQAEIFKGVLIHPDEEFILPRVSPVDGVVGDLCMSLHGDILHVRLNVLCPNPLYKIKEPLFSVPLSEFDLDLIKNYRFPVGVHDNEEDKDCYACWFPTSSQLDCSHTICRKCLLMSLNALEKSDTLFTCGICRRSFESIPPPSATS
jgi:hypothetical protein